MTLSKPANQLCSWNVAYLSRY